MSFACLAIFRGVPYVWWTGPPFAPHSFRLTKPRTLLQANVHHVRSAGRGRRGRQRPRAVGQPHRNAARHQPDAEPHPQLLGVCLDFVLFEDGVDLLCTLRQSSDEPTSVACEPFGLEFVKSPAPTLCTFISHTHAHTHTHGTLADDERNGTHHCGAHVRGAP